MAKKILGAIALVFMLAVAGSLIVLNRLEARGRMAVSEMCAKDGGPAVNETDFAAGFLNDDQTTDQCALCLEAVGKGEFDYVDYQAGNAGRYIPEPGYYRTSVSTQGDPRCEAYLRAREQYPYLRTPQDYGREPGRCYAIERLSGRPQGYVLAQEFRRAAASNGYVLGVVETSIRNELSGRTFAVNRDYLFTAPTSIFFAGPGGITDATCPNAWEWRMDQQKMLTAVLRDDDEAGRERRWIL